MSDITHFFVPNISSCCTVTERLTSADLLSLSFMPAFACSSCNSTIASHRLISRILNSCWDCWRRRLSAAMENASLTSDVWNDVTTSPSDSDDLTLYLANIRDLALKVIYIIIGTVGVLDNLFVLIIFILFIKITEKVLQNCTYRPAIKALKSVGYKVCDFHHQLNIP